MGVAFKTLVIIILCLIGLNIRNQHISALSGITISPLLRDITLGPGLIETSTEITIQNNTDQTVRASLQLVDLRALAVYGGNTLDKAGLTDKYDLAKWLSLPGGDSIIIANRQTVKVKVNVANRPDLSPGGHYGAIIVTTEPEFSTPKSTVSVNQQLVSLLFVKKLGGEIYSMQLEASNYKSIANIPNEFTSTFKNTGNVHVVPRGYIEITDPQGKLIAKGTINQDSLNILPGGLRRIITNMQTISQPTRSGSYKVTTFYRLDGEKDFKQYSQSFEYRLTKYKIYTAGGLIIAGILVLLKIKYPPKIKTVRKNQ